MDKISYLKGLLKGMDVYPESREGKIYYAICGALDEMAEYTEKLENRVAELEELCDILDEDLGTLEEQFDSEEYGCAGCDTKISRRYDEPEEPGETDDTYETDTYLEDEEYETICPTCGKVILLTEQMLEDGETVCPNCGEELEFDFDEEEVQRLAPDESADDTADSATDDD